MVKANSNGHHADGEEKRLKENIAKKLEDLRKAHQALNSFQLDQWCKRQPWHKGS